MVEEKLRILAERIKSHSSAMITEEAVKTAVVLPFFGALGYDISALGSKRTKNYAGASNGIIV